MCKKIILASIILLGSYVSSAATLTDLYILYDVAARDLHEGKLEICSINEHSGLLSNCRTRDIAGISPNAVAVSPGGSNIYISVGRNWIYSCKLIDRDNLSRCRLTAGEFNYPKGMAFDSMHHLYVTNEEGRTITRCQLDKEDGDGHPFRCKEIGNVNYPPDSIAISQDNRYAYVGSSSHGTVGVCPIKEDGKLGKCKDFAIRQDYIKPVSLTLGGSNNYLYLLNANNTYGGFECELVNSGADISRCSNSAVDPSGRPSGSDMTITVLNHNTFAYIAVEGGNINRCKIYDNHYRECVRAMEHYFHGVYSLAVAQKSM